METFILTINQILLMFAFMVIGYVMRKSGKLPESASNILSIILVNVCLTAMVFSTCYQQVTIENISKNGVATVVGIIMMFAAYGLSMLFAKVFAKEAFEKKVYKYAYTAPNFGYMGYPLIQAVFGDEALMLMMMFTLSLNVFIYTKGMSLLCPQKKTGIKNVLLQPTILALIIGTIIGLSGIKLPTIVGKITSSASGCMAPIAMMIAGCVIAEKPIKMLLNDWRVYIASFVKLIIMPMIALLLLTLCRVDPTIVLVASVLWAMPFGLNTVVFPEAYGGDGSKGAKLAFVSHIFAIITIPIVFVIISNVTM